MAVALRDQSDQTLFLLLKGNNATAFEVVFDRYWPLLFRFVHRLLQDRDEATDIVQEVFLVLWEKRETLAADSSLRALLYTVAKNKVLEVIRRSKIRERYLAEVAKVMDDFGPTVHQAVIEQELVAKFEAEVANLPPQMREAFQLRRIEGRSISEIGETMQLSEVTVKRHISRALKVLRDKFSVLIFFLL